MVLEPISDQATVFAVVPCHGREALVDELLSSLRASAHADAGSDRAASAATGILVVDSSPEGRTAARAIEESCQRHGAIYLRGPRSVRSKRNLGIEASLARGADLVLFVDSDCQADPQLIAEHRRAHGRHASPRTGRPIAGTLGATDFRGDEKAAFRAMRLTPFMDSFGFARQFEEAQWAPCANFAVRGDVLRAGLRFREDWDFRLGGDDTEFSRRIDREAGAIVCAPRALVYHSTTTWSRWRDNIHRAWRWGSMDIHVRALEPNTLLRWAGPRPIFVCPLALLLAMIQGDMQGLLLVACLWLLYPLIVALWPSRPGGRWRDRVGAEALVLCFELGECWGALSVRRPRLLLKEAVFHPMQIGLEWDRRRRNGWLSVLLLAASGLLAALPGRLLP